MSRVGKKPIILPTGVEATVGANEIIIKGPKGVLRQTWPPEVKVVLADQILTVSVAQPDVKSERALWGLFRKLLDNMVVGVTKGFEKKLEINGVGFKVALQGNKLVLQLGFSHPVEFNLPEGISAKVEANQITISGSDRQSVGQVAADLRRLRRPEPYKGKGIKYLTETIRRKAGKAAKAGA